MSDASVIGVAKRVSSPYSILLRLRNARATSWQGNIGNVSSLGASVAGFVAQSDGATSRHLVRAALFPGGRGGNADGDTARPRAFRARERGEELEYDLNLGRGSISRDECHQIPSPAGHASSPQEAAASQSGEQVGDVGAIRHSM